MPRLMTVTGQMMQSGISPTLPHNTGLFWKESMNAVFAERSIQPVLGNTLIVAGQGKRPSALLTNRVNKVPTLIMGAQDSIITWTATTGAVEIASGYADDSDWYLETWGNHVVATNGVDPVLYWPAAGIAAPIGIPYTAQIAVHRNPFMVLFNTNVGENHIAWCDEDDITTWITLPDNLAGDLTIRDMDSEIIAALPMGDEIVFYGSDSVHALSFRGSPYVFGANKLYEGIGPFGKHAVCEVARSHFGIGRKGIFVATGSGYELISKDSVHDYVYDDISEDENLLRRSVAYHDEIEELVLFFYPSSEANCNNRCVAYSYRYKSWQPLNIRREACVNVSAFPYGITADYYGNIFLQQTKDVATNLNVRGLGLAVKANVSVGFGSSEFGSIPFGGDAGNSCSLTPVQSNGAPTVNVSGRNASVFANSNELIWVESADYDLGSDGLKRVDTVRLFVEEKLGQESASSDIRLYIAVRNSLCEPLVWAGPYNAVNCVDECLQLEGVFVRLRIEATQPQNRWKLNQIVLNGEIVSEEAPQCRTNNAATISLSQSLRSRAVGQGNSCGGLKTIPEATGRKDLKL